MLLNNLFLGILGVVFLDITLLSFFFVCTFLSSLASIVISIVVDTDTILDSLSLAFDIESVNTISFSGSLSTISKSIFSLNLFSDGVSFLEHSSTSKISSILVAESVVDSKFFKISSNSSSTWSLDNVLSILASRLSTTALSSESLSIFELESSDNSDNVLPKNLTLGRNVFAFDVLALLVLSSLPLSICFTTRLALDISFSSLV